MNFYALTKAMPQAWLPQKLLLVMKLTTLMLIIALAQVSAKGYSQKINLNEKNVLLVKVLESISVQSGCHFFYDADEVDNTITSVIIKDGSIEDALKAAFKNNGFTYKILDKDNVLIKRNTVTAAKSTPNVFESSLPLIEISGKITNYEGKPLPGVTIFNTNSKKGTVTDDSGNYQIPAENGDNITFSFIGFKTRVIHITNQQIISFSLEPSNSALEQVVVIGYGSSKKKDLTGSVSTVDAKDIENIPFGTVDNALAGKAAGVQVTKSDGSPGGAVKIRIRGSSSILGGNDPLYVIDGVPVQVQSNFVSPGYDVGSPVGNDVTGSGGVSAGLSTSFVNGLNSLGGLNTDDIESITILKDASSTAIYGSKAANGVVIITTKKGKRDMPPQITASYYTTVTTAITPHLLNAPQYKTLLTEAAQNDYDVLTMAGYGIPDNTNAILNNASSFFGTANTNWIKEVTRRTMSNNAELSVQGGGNSSKYFSSISYNNTPGVVKGTGFQRISGKINLENEIGKKFRFNTNLILGQTDQNIGDGAYSQALRARPDYAPYDASGNPTDFSEVGFPYQGFQNPVALLSAVNNAKTFSLLGSVSGIYDLTNNLQFKSTASLNMQTYSQRDYTPSYLGIGSYYGTVNNNGGIGSNSNSRFTDWFVENTLSYNKKFGNHSIDFLAGTSYETIKSSFFSATGTGYPNDNVLTGLSSATTPLLVRGDDPTQPQSYLLSFYLRANYAYQDKYLLTFTGRSDGSSKFGPDNKFGYFPSGAIAWRVSKENFLKNIKWIDDIKLRGSYGLTGTQNIGNQMYRTLYTPFSYGGGSALVPTQLGNQAIKWESTRESDGGLDISLFNNRVQATIDYYNKRTSGALLSLPISPSSSYSSLLSNSVGIKNSGLEVALQGDIIRTKNFKWNASVNITWNKSLVTKLSANADLGQIGNLTGLEYGNTTLVQGKPLGLITGLTVRGIIKDQVQLEAYKKELGQRAQISFPFLAIGDPMYELTKSPYGNYLVPNSNTIIAEAAPKYFGGFTQGFTYKNIDLQFYFTFSQGGKLLWGDHVSSMEFTGTSNANVVMLNRYTPDNTNTSQPRLLLNDAYYYKSNLDVFNSSYLKLRTLTVNYRFSRSKWIDKIGMKNASFFITATNLFTITKYPGNDPETSDDPYSVSGGYFDVSNYPSVRTFSLGFKAGF
jgi:TonB-linked SusC/RagA family outer membrane protein